MTSSDEWVSASAPYLTPRTAGTGDAWAEEAAARSGKGTQRLTEAGPTKPPASVAQAFGLEDGADAVVRRRVIYLNDTPVELTDSYYPAHIASGTALAERRKIPGGAVTYLAELGHTASRVREDVTARMPTEGERATLRLSEREPVIVLTRLTLDGDGHPIQADVMTMPATQRLLRYELKVG